MGEETRVLSVGQFKSKVAYYNERKRLVAEEGYVLVGSTKTSVTLKKTVADPAPTPAPAPASKPTHVPAVPIPVKQWVATEFNGNNIVLKFAEPVKDPLATVVINQDGSMTIKKVNKPAPKRNPTPVRRPEPAKPAAAKPAPTPVPAPTPTPAPERSVSKPRGGRRR